MKATQLTIRRYRAFDQEATVPLGGLIVLTGANNLGKSTVLLALRLFFSAFSVSSPRGYTRHYDKDADYPKRYQGKPGRRHSTRVAIQFELSPEDCVVNQADVSFTLPSHINVIAEFGLERNRVSFSTEPPLTSIAKQAVFALVSSRVRFVYIPTGRGIASLREYERSNVQSEIARLALSKVRRTRQRLKALERFVEEAKLELKDLQTELAIELRRFMPDLQSIEFELAPLEHHRLVQVEDIIVDDGAKTSLSQKDDGVKNLFSIALLQFVAKQDPGDQLILGIEEPEAHLHSDAIYKLKPELRHLADNHIVLVTTHSPILINRDEVGRNYIIGDREIEGFSSTIRAAKSLAEIRKSLGIKPHENMLTAAVVLVVEGDSDKSVFDAVLRKLDATLCTALEEGRIRILAADGATKVAPILRALIKDAASCLVIFDNDEEGRKSSEDVLGQGLCPPSDVTLVPNRDNCRDTELEDLIEPGLYLNSLNQVTGLGITADEFENARRQSGSRGNKIEKW